MPSADPQKTRQRIWWHLASALRLMRTLEGYKKQEENITTFMTLITKELTKRREEET